MQGIQQVLQSLEAIWLPQQGDFHRYWDMMEVANIPFEKFGNSAAILYMHEYDYQYPNILSKVTGKYFIVD